MNTEFISESQGTKLVILFILGSTLVMGTGGEAGKDTWLAVIFAIVFSVPVVLVYSKILSLFPEKDIFDILVFVFGKVFGKLLCLLFIWFSFHLGALVIRNFGEFILSVALPETPILVPMGFLTFACIYGAKLGIETVGRFSELFIIIIIIITILFSLLTIPYMDLKNIRPVAGDGIMPILQGAFSALAFPFGETVIFIMLLSSLKKSSSPSKVYMTGLLIGGFIVALIGFRNILVLGEYGLASSYFPSYTALSRINIRRFILQRVEIIVSVVFLTAGFIKITLCLIAACKGYAKLFNFKDYKFIVTPMGILMVLLAFIIYPNIMEMSEWAFSTWTYYAFPFQVILPFIVLISAKIKLRLSNSKH